MLLYNHIQAYLQLSLKQVSEYIIQMYCYTTYMLCSNMWYSCLWAKFGVLQCCLQCISIIPRIKLFVHYLMDMVI